MLPGAATPVTEEPRQAARQVELSLSLWRSIQVKYVRKQGQRCRYHGEKMNNLKKKVKIPALVLHLKQETNT